MHEKRNSACTNSAYRIFANKCQKLITDPIISVKIDNPTQTSLWISFKKLVTLFHFLNQKEF